MIDYTLGLKSCPAARWQSFGGGGWAGEEVAAAGGYFHAPLSLCHFVTHLCHIVKSCFHDYVISGGAGQGTRGADDNVTEVGREGESSLWSWTRGFCVEPKSPGDKMKSCQSDWSWNVKNLRFWQSDFWKQHLEGDLEVCEDKLQLATQKLDKVRTILTIWSLENNYCNVMIQINWQHRNWIRSAQSLGFDRRRTIITMLSFKMVQTTSNNLIAGDQLSQSYDSNFNWQHGNWKRS